jgi:hypothetical protein
MTRLSRTLKESNFNFLLAWIFFLKPKSYHLLLFGNNMYKRANAELFVPVLSLSNGRPLINLRAMACQLGRVNRIRHLSSLYRNQLIIWLDVVLTPRKKKNSLMVQNMLYEWYMEQVQGLKLQFMVSHPAMCEGSVGG